MADGWTEAKRRVNQKPRQTPKAERKERPERTYQLSQRDQENLRRPTRTSIVGRLAGDDIRCSHDELALRRSRAQLVPRLTRKVLRKRPRR